jgi:hypothetical protein
MQTGLLPAFELPEAAGVIDVTRPPCNADNTGRRDATAALLQAMHEAGRRTPGIFTTTDRAVQIVYLPKGIYRISDTLCFETAEIRAARPTKEAGRRRYIEGHMMLVGEDRDATIVRLEDRCPNFQASPKPMLRMTLKDASNQSYFNSVQDLTLDAGHGNPGAVGLRFVSSNLGGVRHTLIRCPDRVKPASVGLDLTTGAGGLGYIRDVRVEGFRKGVEVGSFHPAYTFENLELLGQHEVGFENTDKSVQILNFRSTNSVPAIRNRTPAGQMVLLNSWLAGGPLAGTASTTSPTGLISNVCAIENDGYLFARDVEVRGYPHAIRNQGQPASLTKEFFSAGKTLKLWPKAPDHSLRLEIRDTPPMPVAGERWTVFDPQSQDDDTAALQSLVDSGAEAIFIRGAKGRVRLTNTLKLRGNLRRLHGGWCNLDVQNKAGDHRPLFEIFTTRHPVTQLEAFSNGQDEHRFTMIVNHSDKTVVLKDLFLGYGHGTYRNTGSGDLFIESVVSGGGDFDEEVGMRPLAGWLIRNQRVWARNWNPEAYLPGISLDQRAQAWCLGAKIGEIYGPYLEVRKGSRLELLGCVFNTSPPHLWKRGRKGVAIQVEDADLSLIAVDRIRDGAGEGSNPIMVSETHQGEFRSLRHSSLPRRWPGNANNLSVVIPLYRSAENK